MPALFPFLLIFRSRAGRPRTPSLKRLPPCPVMLLSFLPQTFLPFPSLFWAMLSSLWSPLSPSTRSRILRPPSPLLARHRLPRPSSPRASSRRARRSRTPAPPVVRGGGRQHPHPGCDPRFQTCRRRQGFAGNSWDAVRRQP